jgi:4-amino-4-deoxy-L-arabinose transferase-like glycosyltransferase
MIATKDNSTMAAATAAAAGAGAVTARPAVAVRGLERARVLGWLSLAFPLAVSAALNMWNLAQNGYSNLYYSVAVQSMIQNWHNFFFASYDAGGFISVDKPPVALWVQAISAKLFGFSPLSLLLPQALLGVASVALVYFLVKRVFGTFAAFVAALVLAVTPIAVAVERTNNTDTVLMFTLLLAALALSLAAEKGRFALLAVGLALVGVAFNVKMLAAFVVLPAFYLMYFAGAPIRWPKRMLHLALGSLVVFGVALSWPLAVDLTPAAQRPWVGGSQVNSVVDLALGYNGLGRVTGNEGAGRGGFSNVPGGLRYPCPIVRQRDGQAGPPGGQTAPGFGPGTFPPLPNPRDGGRIGRAPVGPGGGGMFGAGVAGPTRLFTGQMAGQWSWLFPLLLVGFGASALTIRRWWPLDRRGQALVLWGGWLGTYGVVFSIAEGIFHPYYLIMLAPAAAALVGLGVAALWRAYRRGGWAAWLLPAALAATAAWQVNMLSEYPEWSAWLTPLLLGGSLIAAVGLVATRVAARLHEGRGYRLWRQLSTGMLGIGVVALLLAPGVWSMTPVLAGPSNASLPTSGPEALNQNDPTSWTRMNAAGSSGLVRHLEENQDGYLYLVAVTNSQQASSIALTTGKPVLAAGGFMGSDPALTAERLAEMVASKQVRYVMGLGGGMRGFGVLGNTPQSSVEGWVQANCSAVDPRLYSSGTGAAPGGFTGAFSLGNAQLYNCAP